MTKAKIPANMIPVASSAFKKLGWHEEVLYVEYPGNVFYKYYPVPQIVQTLIMNAESAGQALDFLVKKESVNVAENPYPKRLGKKYHFEKIG
jgi:hypothetical protein